MDAQHEEPASSPLPGSERNPRLDLDAPIGAATEPPGDCSNASSAQRVAELERENAALRHARSADAAFFAQERARLQAELQASRDFTQRLTDNLPAFLAYVEPADLRYEFVNQQFTASFQRAREQVVGQRVADVVGERNFQYALPFIEQARAGERTAYINTFSLVDGLHWLEVNLIPDFDQRHQVRGIIVLGYDITARKQAEAALQASEARLNEAQAIAHVGNWELDLVSNVLNWSAEIYRIFEVDPARFGASYAAFLAAIHPDDRAAVNAAYATSVQNRTPYAIEHRLLFPDGRLKYVREQCTTFYDADGKALRSVGVVQDITQRRQDEEQIKQQLSEITFYYDNAPIGLAVLDADLRYVRVNKLLAEINGVPAAHHIGKTVGEIVPDLAEQIRQITAEIRRTGAQVMPVELSGETAAQPGVTHYWRVGWYPIKRADKEIIGYSVIVEDITERKQATEALKRSEANLHALIENTDDLIASRDHAGRLVAFNSSFAKLAQRMFGVEMQPGLRTLDSRSEAAQAHWEAMLDQVYAGAKHQEEFTWEFPDETRHYELSLHPIWHDGAVIGSTEFTRDITARKQAEQERAQLQAQLAQAQKLESIGRLAGGIAHEFNNMLSVIMLRTEMALKTADPATPLHRNLTAIYTTAQRSAELVRQLLGFARKQTISPRVLDLNATIESSLPMLRKLIGEEIEIIWHPAAPLWSVKMDPAQIDQILANLCVNARDAIAGVGMIAIETANVAIEQATATSGLDIVPGDYVMLTVSDSGSGMDQATLAHIFDPFFTTKDVGKGAGLGLATVDGIVQQNHGQIQVRSEPGIGTTFKVFLPCLAEAADAAPAPHPAPALPQGHGETVLLVEDEVAVLNMATEALQCIGYTVLAAATPHAALYLIGAHTGAIHLLITDVIMPEMNGQALAAQIVAIQPGIKLLYMSGYPADFIASRGLLEAGVHFLQKPFTLQGLAAKVREALAET